jgi:hypothetical protein
MPERMCKFLFNLPESQLDSLRDMSRDSGIPISHQIRIAINNYLAGGVDCAVVCSGGIASGRLMLVRG